MIHTEPGVFPWQSLHRLVQYDHVWSPTIGWKPAIQPASIDLQVGTRAYRLRSSFLPRKSHDVDYYLKSLATDVFDIPSTGILLERDIVYLIPLQENLSLPDFVSASANPKSTTGRLDVFTRLVTKDGCRFDSVPAGYSGPLFLEVCPRSFPVRVRPGSKLNQLRFRGAAHPSFLSTTEIVEELSIHADPPFVVGDGGQVVHASLYAGGEVMAYRARKFTDGIDVDTVAKYDVMDFWDAIPRADSLILDPGEFYILASMEFLVVPPHLAGEMVPIDASLGEFRVHYAGFFDPGFGNADPSRAVLEVRARDVPFVLTHGQPVAIMRYEHMAEIPQIVYGESSNYQGQGLRLAKNFKV